MKRQTTNDQLRRMQTSLNMSKADRDILQRRVKIANWMIVAISVLLIIILITAPYCANAQSREQEQTLIHGAGGCTPNFSTGGCL